MNLSGKDGIHTSKTVHVALHQCNEPVAFEQSALVHALLHVCGHVLTLLTPMFSEGDCTHAGIDKRKFRTISTI